MIDRAAVGMAAQGIVQSTPGLTLTFVRGCQAFKGGWWLLPLTAVVVPSRIPPTRGLGRLSKRKVSVRLRHLEGVIDSTLDEVWGCVELWVHACYDAPYIEWERLRTVLDIGANNGASAVWIALRASRARIIALEPCRETAARASENILRNALEARVRVVVLAVAGATGSVQLIRSTNSRLTRTAPASNTTTDLAQAISFDEAVHLSGGHCDLVKIDVEGAEYEIFASATDGALRSCGTILGEYHRAPAREQEALFHRLQAASFRVKVVADDTVVAGMTQGTFVAWREDWRQATLTESPPR